jgi:hypothetical protein
MFLTNNFYRSKLSNYLHDEDETYWHAAQVVHNQPWFVVKIIQTIALDNEEKTLTHRTILFSSIGDVDELMQDETSDRFTVDSVSIVTPSYMNGTKGWKMECLRAVWTAKEPLVPTQAVQIYETVEGSFYSTSALETPVEKLCRKAIKLAF